MAPFNRTAKKMQEQAPGPSGYRLAAPSRDDAMAFLARALGADKAASVWTTACRAAGVSPATRDMGVDALIRVADWLGGQPGVVGVIGQSLLVRLRTYRLLSRNKDAHGG